MNKTTINFLLTLKNSSMSNKEECKIKLNSFSLAILKILYEEGFIQSFFRKNEYTYIKLRIHENKALLTNLKLISKPSKIVTLSSLELRFFSQKTRFLLVSTTQGLKTGVECKNHNLGGQLLFIC